MNNVMNTVINKKVCVIGLGYIGLPTAVILARAGYSVRGVDVKNDVVETINTGVAHIIEPGLNDALQRVVLEGRFTAFTEPAEADIFIICVPTPLNTDDTLPRPNVSHVLRAVRTIAPIVRPGNYIILESTSPVGTTKKLAEALAEHSVSIDNLRIAYCPERVIPGRAMIELIENDRIVGGLTPEAAESCAEFYRSVVTGTILTTNAATAEMVKLSENSFRDVNIAFANELSILAANMGVHVQEVIALANRHPRVNILQPGPGVGGHCIAVDPWFLISQNPDSARLIQTARQVNNDKTEWVIENIRAAAAKRSAELNRPPRIVLLGLTFKPDIDDLRESPALKIAETLYKQNYRIQCVEPHITEHARLPLVSLTEGLKMADIVVGLVKHSAFSHNTLSEHIDTRAGNSAFLNFAGL